MRTALKWGQDCSGSFQDLLRQYDMHDRYIRRSPHLKDERGSIEAIAKIIERPQKIAVDTKEEGTLIAANLTRMLDWRLLEAIRKLVVGWGKSARAHRNNANHGGSSSDSTTPYEFSDSFLAFIGVPALPCSEVF